MNRKPSEKDSEESSKSQNSVGNSGGNNPNLPNNSYTANNVNPTNMYAPPPTPGYMIPPGYNPYYPW